MSLYPYIFLDQEPKFLNKVKLTRRFKPSCAGLPVAYVLELGDMFKGRFRFQLRIEIGSRTWISILGFNCHGFIKNPCFFPESVLGSSSFCWFVIVVLGRSGKGELLLGNVTVKCDLLNDRRGTSLLRANFAPFFFATPSSQKDFKLYFADAGETE
jgi:hypothetical protein